MRRQAASKIGLFITFEGIDGSGKSTQAQLLADYLQSEGCTFSLVRDPGSTAVAEEIRRLLKSDVWKAQREAKTELFLHLAARAHLWERKILPLLRRGAIVISDRYSDSTLAYQGLAEWGTVKFLSYLSDFCSPQPNITFLLDVNPETAIERVAGSRDLWDSIGLETMSRIRKMYLDMVARFPGRITVIDGGESVGRIQARIRAVIRAECEAREVYGWRVERGLHA